jgi:ribonuclease P/MRP protein subunit POP5
VRRRYLALEVDCEEPLESVVLSEAIWNAVLRLFGEMGASQAGLYLVRFDEKTRTGVLRCSHTTLPMVRAAVASITRIGNAKAAVHVLRVSGTLKALSRKSTRTVGLEHSP